MMRDHLERFLFDLIRPRWSTSSAGFLLGTPYLGWLTALQQDVRELIPVMGRRQMNPLETYLSELAEIRSSGAAVPETSYYVPLANLLNEIGKTLKPRVRCNMTLKNRGAGLPDGGLFTPNQFRKTTDAEPLPGQNPERGVIEIKSTSDDAWVTASGKQVSRYWGKYGQVLVTNYRDFVLVGRDADGKPAKLETYRLAEDEASFWKAASHGRKTAEQHAVRFLEYLKRVMVHTASITAPQDLAWFLASYARDALARVEQGDLPALATVQGAMEQALGVKFEGKKGQHFFKSTLVQTLFYGVFSAWVLWHKEGHSGRFDWHSAEYYLRVPMLVSLYAQVANPNRLKPLDLMETLDCTADVLNRVDRETFFARFEEHHAVQYFYEPFLEAFDPELRKELGIWYTPPEIIQYMVARVDTVLREELDIEDGLADPRVLVLDPCCGTGGYLVEVLKRIAVTLKDKGEEALIPGDIKEAACKRVFGFEILPAPFVISHLQIGLLLQNLGAPLTDDPPERAAVYLTNALTGWEPPTSPKNQLPLPEFEQERELAEKVKREAPILVVLGNPPYNGFAGVSPKEEQGLLTPYKAGLKEWGITKNYLDDLYVRFFRLAERRIAEQTGEGVVCFISNFSYLTDPSFVVMRQRFLSGFDKLWFDCMNGDSRQTGKLTPDGLPDPSVFSTEYNREGIRVGTVVATIVRKRKREQEPLVRYRQFWGVTKRADLVASLSTKHFVKLYSTARPSRGNRFLFRPSAVAEGYNVWPDLVALSAAEPMLGLNDNRGQATHDVAKAEICKRMSAYYDPNVTNQEIMALHPGLGTDAASFNAKATRARLQRESKFREQNVVHFWFKPYDLRWAYVERVGNLWNRVRPELLDQAWEGNTFLLARRHAPKSHDGSTFFASRYISDQHMLSTDAYFIPFRLRIRPTKKGMAPQDALFAVGETTQANYSAGARAYLAALGVPNPDADADTAALIWVHALAIGYSPAYLSENADGIRQDWPRIPLPGTKDKLLASASLGRQIAALLDTESPVKGVTASPIRDEFISIAVLSCTPGSAPDLSVTAGWGHAGKDGVTMPGRGRIVERSECGKATYDVYLNETTYWKNIPVEVWEYIIGGYQVIKKWLSYRERDLLGRALTNDEAREVTNMARRIAAIMLLQGALDRNYRQAAQSAYTWPTKDPAGRTL